MALTILQEISNQTVLKKYAVDAFDTFDYGLTETILEAAEIKGNQPQSLII
jgi:fructose/tagatose bisphosphate aldolase